MSTNEGQSAAMPSPFPPIADYGFLSDCHTGALVAPDGGVDWLCVPRFDAPSVFGSLLDREAGTFRFGPFGINVPTQRVTRPGTNVLVTTWKTPSGWVVVKDTLTIGPSRGPDVVTPHTRPPADDDAEHILVRTAECVDGQVEIELVCEPVFDYGARPGHLGAGGRDRPHGGRHRAGVTIRLHTDMSIGVEGGRARARHTLRPGDKIFCALSWADGPAVPDDVDDAAARVDTTVGSGGTGWTGPGSPTTAGAIRSSAPRWRSRGSPTCPRARPSPRSRRRFPRRPAVSATGTTGTAGCATPRSRCRRCTG